MMSDSLTKVMTTPANHVQKCGLKDIKTAFARMVVTTHTVAVETTAVTIYGAATDHEGSDLPFMKIEAVLFMLGLLTGIIMAKRLQTWWAVPLKIPLLRTIETQTDEQAQSMPVPARTSMILPTSLYIAPATGRHFHLTSSAGERRAVAPCERCTNFT
jgi:hypothetical protein